MSKLYTLGFFLIAGGAFGAIDYNQQAINAGKTLQTYDIASYADVRLGSVGGIFTGALEAKRLKRRQQKPASTHLPEPPEGWARRPWADSDKAVFLPYSEFSMGGGGEEPKEGTLQMDYAALYESYTPLQLIDVAKDEDPDANFLEKSMRMPKDKMLHRDVFIYRKNVEFVALRATYDPRFDKPKSAVELAMLALGAQIGGTMQVPGYAYYDGVPFKKDKQILRMEFVPRGIRVVSAEVSPSIRVQAWYMASDESVRDLLSKVDYTALNAMLDKPVERVTDMPDMELDDQLAKATEILTAKKKAELAKADSFIAKLEKKSKGSSGLLGLNAEGMDQLAAIAALENGRGKVAPGQAEALGLPPAGVSQPGAEDQGQAQPSAAGVFGAMLGQLQAESSDLMPKRPTPQANVDKAGGSVISGPLNMPGFDPENLSGAERAHVAAAKGVAHQNGDAGDQDAARVMELRRGLPGGTCVHDHNANKVRCGDNAKVYRTQRDVLLKTMKKKAGKPAATAGEVPKPVTFAAPGKMSGRDQMAMSFRLMGAGLKPEDAQVRFDGITPDAAQQWSQMRDGTLAKDHFAYKVRSAEVSKNLAPGSCLEVASGKVYCEKIANMIRTARVIRDRNKAEKTSGKNDGVKVNRLGGGGATRTAASGLGGKKCTTNGAFKSCTVSD